MRSLVFNHTFFFLFPNDRWFLSYHKIQKTHNGVGIQTFHFFSTKELCTLKLFLLPKLSLPRNLKQVKYQIPYHPNFGAMQKDMIWVFILLIKKTLVHQILSSPMQPIKSLNLSPRSFLCKRKPYFGRHHQIPNNPP